MQIATWNVNSLRIRLDQVCGWLESNPKLDVLCLQETKVVDADFPQSEFKSLGYQPHFVGQKSYNGVAILSRDPMVDLRVGFASVLGSGRVGDLDEQKRVICGEVNGIRIINLYVPNGSEVGSEKYEYKLRWLDLLTDYLSEWLQPPDPQVVVCGDFNIAPEDRDIHDPKKAGQIMASPLERDALAKIANLGLQDGFRKFTQATGYYSWWDYRSGGFARNRGWRIDHHYVSLPLYNRANACWIDTEPRGSEQPSDHTPVIIEL